MSTLDELRSNDPGKVYIAIPRFWDGYKTIFISILTVAFGLANVVWPEFQAPTAETVTLFVDQLSGAIITALGVINFFLRLVTDSPIGGNRYDTEPLMSDEVRVPRTMVPAYDDGEPIPEFLQDALQTGTGIERVRIVPEDVYKAGDNGRT